MRKLEISCLLMILIFGLIMRIYGLNWDQGYHLHPDERAIIMVSERISWPKTGEWPKLLTPESTLNPKFFAYGSFSIYLLKFTGFIASFFDKTLVQYDKINLLGRVISAIFDIGTIYLIYLLTKFLFKKNHLIPLSAALFYSASVLPIQLSHFFAVDTILNFFIFLTLFFLIKFIDRQTLKSTFLLSLSFSFALSTKFTAILLLPIIILSFLKSSVAEKISLKQRVEKFISTAVFYGLCSLFFVFLLMPYAFIDFPTFVANVSEQLRLAKDPYVFPFTLQYVNTPAYIYPLAQIFVWGLGPFITTLSIAGLLIVLKKISIIVYTMILRRGIQPHTTTAGFIVGVFYLTYFLVMGQSAVKFMRYYLPLYPTLSILAAYFIDMSLTRAKHVLGTYRAFILLLLLLVATLIWPLSFVSIYNNPNTRVTASLWISQNIKENSVLAVEPWDDRLPLSGGEKYNFVEMPMYDPDGSEAKWKKIDDNLKKADYIILASNRLYTPLQKLTDCSKIRYDWRCYPKTARYYHNLFSGDLGFKEIAEFTNYPKFPILGFEFSTDDSAADENFTVFDHPKITIFKKL